MISLPSFADRRVTLLIVLCLVLVMFTRRTVAQEDLGENPAAAMQTLFDRMAENSGPAAPFFGRLTDEQITQLDAIDVSPAEEAAFGRKVFERFAKTLRQQGVELHAKSPELAYIRQLLVTLQPQMSKPKRYPRLQVFSIDADGEDAYSIPGGYILVSRGLIDKANSEAALVGVLAHELSHLDRGHQLLPLKQAKLSRQPLNVQDGMMLVSLVARPFRPEQETQADLDATAWMMATGYQPDELVRLLVRWDQKQNETMPWQKFVPGFVKSHPDAGLRAQAVNRFAIDKRAQYPEANYIGRENLKRQIPRTIREILP